MTYIGLPNQACYLRKFVRQFLCVNFAYANSYVPNAIRKTLLHTKNRKFLRKYTHDLSCRTTENFRKDSELMKLPQCWVSCFSLVSSNVVIVTMPFNNGKLNFVQLYGAK